MHPSETVAAARARAADGAPASSIAAELGVPRRTVADWLAGARQRRPHPCACPQCGVSHDLPTLPDAYVYLLGLYLGDGCLARHRRQVYRLRIFLDTAYPGIITAAQAAIAAVRGRPAGVLPKPPNCAIVSSYWRGWPCLFPQHGPGKKHERTIALEPWQSALVARWPEQLLRGLIQSDGCRFINTGRNWTCPRYSFTNYSADIHAIFRDACALIGVHWTASGEHTTYVSRRADVAHLDTFIGPKR